MRFEISKSLYPDGKIRYIARDTGDVVRLRADTEEGLIEAIKEYNEQLVKEAEEKAKAATKGKGKGKDKGKGESVKGEEIAEEVEEVESPELVIEGASQPFDSAQGEPPESPEPFDPASTNSAQSDSEASEPKKKFLQSEVKEQIEEKRKKTGKKSFWDKLK